MPTKRVVLESITARLLWDGRAEDGRFIPGVAHFEAGVRAVRRAAAGGVADAERRLGEIDEALGKAEGAVNRWARGLAGFVRDRFGDDAPGSPGWSGTERRTLRVRTPEAERLAELIRAFDAACAATAAATILARGRGVFNPHHGSIAGRARMIRRVADLGHAGGLACRARRRHRRSAGV